jgi:hypothetical protein
MFRFLLAPILALTACSASAANWPWQDPPEERLDYCKGFVISGLASSDMESRSRVNLWLAWNYIIRTTEDGAGATGPDFQLGRDQFKTLADADNITAILEEADSTCAFGRS